ncbi:GtrA family protein [Bacillus sp. EB01]|uniref:GtrA family protein n=1 Tax=Bacillus sp. EB01 TaxID=1347086 RepID=UPI0005C4D693|nr:GtrA family protein [Bacillus sp. EB01]
MKNRELYKIFMYLVMGVLTTLVNIVIYWLAATPIELDYRVATTIAWIASVLFAYVTNKRYVFQTHTPTIQALVKEMASFFGFRFLSFLMDLGAMILLVSVVGINDTWAKVFANGIVLVANYVFSKVFIFKEKSEA